MSEIEEKPKSIFEDYNISQTVQAAIDGIKKFRNHPNFKFYMGTWGGTNGGTDEDLICYGCLATVTVFTAMNEEPDSCNIEYPNHPVNGYTRDSVSLWEDSLDMLRTGNVYNFLWGYGYQNDCIHMSQQEMEELSIKFSKIGKIPDMERMPTEKELDDFVRSLEVFKEFLIERGY